MNKGLLIGLIIGGVALLITIIAVVAIIIAANSAKPNIITDETRNNNVDPGTNIIAIAVGDDHTVGLKKDGTVVAVGVNYDDRCETGTRSKVIELATGGYYSVALKEDGTLYGTGASDDGQLNVGGWKLKKRRQQKMK